MPRVLVLGSSNTDLALKLPRLPEPGQTVLGGALRTGPGGKGANQAVAAARAGAGVVFVAAVGDDDFGRLALDAYRREGVDVRHAKVVAGVPSGVALIFLGGDAENMIGVAPGANARLDAASVDALPVDLFESADLLLVAGLEVPLGAVGAAVRRAIRAGCPVVLNPAPAVEGLLGSGVLGGVDVVTPNRGELRALTGVDPSGEEGLVRAVERLRALGPRGVVVTLGSDGCLVAGSDGTLARIGSQRVVAEDTVGAGDAFNGALAAALAGGKALREAAVWANAAAALAVTRPGAQASLPRLDEIDRLAAVPPEP